jgi:GT2 family glycosyltransferase
VAESADARFTGDVLRAAREAEASSGVIVQRLDIAGVRIDLHYAGTALNELFAPALAHLEVERGDRASDGPLGTRPVVIRLWDTRSTGVVAPASPVPQNRFTDRGDVIGMDDPAYRVAFHWSEYSVCVLDVEAGEAAYWVADTAYLPYWSRSSPVRTILGWILESRGRQVLHAAAVATEDGAALIVGGGGAGKSTTALTCLVAGMDFLGDDYVVVTSDPPTVHSLYSTAKVADAAHPAVGVFPAYPSSPDDEKIVLQLHPAAASRVLRSAPLRAVVASEIVDGEATRVTGVDRDRLEHAATFTTLAQLPHAGAVARARIGRVLDEVPNGLLSLGREPSGIVDAIRRLIAEPRMPADGGDLSDLPSVTVVIPVLNGALFLAAAVESILTQKYPRLEIVVVDDGSDDDLAGAVAALPVDVRVQHQATSGPAAARNTGIGMATSDLVAFLDVDDRWPPGSLIALVRGWLLGGASVVAGQAHVVELDPETGEERPVWTPEEVFPYYIGSAVFERTVFDRVGFFDPGMLYGEDTDWFARLAESDETLRRLPVLSLVVRRHGRNMTEGLDLVQLHVVRTIKNALDRKRRREP